MRIHSSLTNELSPELAARLQPQRRPECCERGPEAAVARKRALHEVGKALGLHCLKEARRAGFLAMQFNLVVSTNEAAVGLWQKLGFTIVGTLPKVFRHRERGYVDAYVMHRFLDDIVPWPLL